LIYFNLNILFFRSSEALQAATESDGLAARDPPVSHHRMDHWICVQLSSSSDL